MIVIKRCRINGRDQRRLASYSSQGALYKGGLVHCFEHTTHNREERALRRMRESVSRRGGLLQSCNSQSEDRSWRSKPLKIVLIREDIFVGAFLFSLPVLLTSYSLIVPACTYFVLAERAIVIIF